MTMSYAQYETKIVKTCGIKLVGWPRGIKIANCSVLQRDDLVTIYSKLSGDPPEIFFTKMEASEWEGEKENIRQKKVSKSLKTANPPPVQLTLDDSHGSQWLGHADIANFTSTLPSISFAPPAENYYNSISASAFTSNTTNST